MKAEGFVGADGFLWRAERFDMVFTGELIELSVSNITHGSLLCIVPGKTLISTYGT